MSNRLQARALSLVTLLSIGLALAAVPGSAAAQTRAKLVHCGADTCLRLTGNREHAAVVVRIAGRAIAVEGTKSWRVTLPVAAVRGAVDRSNETLVVMSADPRTGTERTEAAILPPGALGRPIELPSFTVYAH